MEQEALFEEPEHLPPRTDGTWLVAPAPDCWRYQLLGEDGETLMIEGHGINDDGIRDVLLHAGQWWGFDEPVPAERTWATELDRCPRHRRWLRCPRRAGIASVDWVRYQVLRVLWKLWWSKDPLRQWRHPRWLKRLQKWWRGVEYCSCCEWVEHYRGEAGASYWLWDLDNPGADRGRRGYLPVTIVELEV